MWQSPEPAPAQVRDGADALLYRYYYDADGKRRIKAKAVSGNTDWGAPLCLDKKSSGLRWIKMGFRDPS